MINNISYLSEKFGSPLYVFDEDAFVDNYMNLLNAFRQIYPKYNIAYSYKTNYTPYVCNIVKSLGGYAEVVSSMEYILAKKIGYTADRIIFNGPVKGEKIFEQLKEGGVVNIDNLDEFEKVLAYAKRKPSQIIKLAFRVNIDIEQGFISRFGVDADNGDLEYVFKVARTFGNIRIEGIHCHVGRSRNLQAWANRINIMLALTDKYFEKPPRFIDLGSGMSSVMEPSLAAQFSDNIPTYNDYAAVVAVAMANKYGNLPLEDQPELITEPGTTVISGYLSFVTTVLSIKTVKDKTIATFDGSVGNMGDICKLKALPISVHKNNTNVKLYKDVDFVGFTCLEHDVMYKDYSGDLSVGSVVEFRNIGSYSNVFKPPFISPNCAMVAVSKSYGVKLIKRTETFDDIFQTYKF